MNVCTGILRRQQRRRLLALKMETPVRRETSGDRVWEAVLALKPALRAVLVLFYFQGLSCEETAEALGCSVGAARTRLHRARKAFKDKYEELGNEV